MHQTKIKYTSIIIALFALQSIFGWSAIAEGQGELKIAPKQEQNTTPQDILVRIGDWSVTKADLQRRIDGFPPDQRGYLQTEQQKNKLLSNIVQTRLLALEAKAAKLDQQEPLKASIVEVIDFYLANAYIAEKLSDISISDDDIKKLYEKNQSEFKIPPKVHVKHILVKLNLNAPLKDVQDALEKASKIKKELDEGADFAKLAEKYSEDVNTSKKGGDIGLVSRGEIIADVGNAAFQLKVGQISQPVRSIIGYHIILVTDIKNESTVDLSEATPQIREILFKEKQQEAIAKEVDRLKKKYDVKG